MSKFNEEKYTDCEIIKKRLYEIRTGKNVTKEVPKVTVIIPAYKVAAYISETLHSVFAQTFKDYEVILINDGSPDTLEMEQAIEPFLENIIYLKQENGGVSKARNAGICLARGRLIGFLDGDDEWLPEFLESQVSFLELNGLDMVYCDALLYGDNYYNASTYMQSAPSHGKVSTVTLLSAKCNAITSGTVLRKEILAKTNLFDTGLPAMQDFDLWLRIAQAGFKIDYQNKILLKYRVLTSGLSGSNVERASRNIRALEVAKSKYELSPLEREAWEKQMRLSQAEYETEKGKLSLTLKDFNAARKHFAEANKLDHKIKLSILISLLGFAPNLALHLFKKYRPSEFSFISSEN